MLCSQFINLRFVNMHMDTWATTVDFDRSVLIRAHKELGFGPLETLLCVSQCRLSVMYLKYCFLQRFCTKLIKKASKKFSPTMAELLSIEPSCTISDNSSSYKSLGVALGFHTITCLNYVCFLLNSLTTRLILMTPT